jgi:hypothetical protein
VALARGRREREHVERMTRQDDLDDAALLELVQRQTFRYFWDFAHPVSGLARERSNRAFGYGPEVVTTGGSGFGVMAVVIGAARGWITRQDAVARLLHMVRFLQRADSYHGVLPHFLHGETGRTIPFTRKDDGGDLVETSFLLAGLLCARQYFDREDAQERELRNRINALWREAEWDWHTRGGRSVLYWHWSPNQGWSMNHEIRGWNECLVTYVLAASSPRYPIDPEVYHRGFAQGRSFTNGRAFYGIALPLGPEYGGPLFFAHYSFLGLDPRGLKDRYADYWQQNVAHTLINREHCVRNPHGFVGYGPDCWGLTSSDDHQGYHGHAPDRDLGVITPSAALSSLPYTPDHSMAALRHFYHRLGDRIWGEYGFVDAFSETHDWYATWHLAIDQGPIVAMIENHRTALLWNLFMSCPEIQAGLRKLDFTSPHLAEPAVS